MQNTATTGQAILRKNWQKALMTNSVALGVGETLTFTYSFGFDSDPANLSNRELLDVGITTAANTGITVGSQIQVDVGSDWEFEDAAGEETVSGLYQANGAGAPTPTAGVYNTFTTTITKSASVANTFEVTASVAGDPGAGYSYTIVDSATYALSSVFVGFIGQIHTDDVFEIEMDSFKLEHTTVPEPGTYALLGGLFALGFVMVRRRK